MIGGTQPYQRIDELVWNNDELTQGKLVKVRGFPANHKVKLLGVTMTHRAGFVAINNLSQSSTDAVQDVWDVRS